MSTSDVLGKWTRFFYENDCTRRQSIRLSDIDWHELRNAMARYLLVTPDTLLVARIDEPNFLFKGVPVVIDCG